MDDLLNLFLSTRDEAESQQILEGLICGKAQPLVKEIVSYKLRAFSPASGDRDGQEIEDVCGDVILKLVRRLRQHKASPEDSNISNLRGYVAAMAYNESDEYLRRKRPERSSLKNKLRYVLTHHAELAIWTDRDGQTLCGFDRWRGRGESGQSPLTAGLLQDDLKEFLQQRLERTALTKLAPNRLLGAIFEFAGAPVEIDKL